MINNRITELYSKKLSGEATVEELQELDSYLQENPDEQYFQEIFSNWWNSNQPGEHLHGKERDVHFNYILQQASSENAHQAQAGTAAPVLHISRYRFLKRISVAVAAACIVFFAAWKFFSVDKAPQLPAQQENEIIAKRGTKSKLLLPDGTQVWLNAESKITYNTAFNGKLREVTLEGEAYFDVVKDPGRPFIVHTSAINIRVLGTAFNVKSYPQDSTIEAVLVRGLIEVEKNNQQQTSKILLHPNEKLVYNKLDDKPAETSRDRQRVTPATVNSIRPQSISISTLPKNIVDSSRIETSWVYGKLLFEGDTFKELGPKMERWFNVKIILNDSKIANYRFRGVFENENIEEALQALQLIAPFKYTINGNEVLIDKK